MAAESVIQHDPAGGNTRTPARFISPSKKWCFTLNNYTEEEACSINLIIPEFCKQGGYGREIGEKCGTPHLQGWIEFKVKARPMERFQNHRISWRKMKGTIAENIEYCSKDKEYWAYGHKVPKPLKLITEFRPWQQEVVDMVKEEPDDRSIHWFYDRVGNVGKSALVKYLCARHGAIICAGKAADMKYMIVEYKKTHGDFPDLIIFDVPRTSMDYISYTGIEEIKNGCFASTKYECGMVVMNSPHVLVFANEPPKLGAMSQDRWKIKEL